MTTKSPTEARAERIKSLLDADITFVVGPEKHKIPAYSQLLILANDVFRVMLKGGSFGYENKTEYEIPEFSPKDFKNFLEYMYNDKIDFVISTPCNIYKIAHQFMVKPLCESCLDHICKNLNEYDIFKTLEWNLLYQEVRVLDAIEKYFSKNLMFIVESNVEEFLLLSKGAIKQILNWNRIRCSEDFLYELVLKWAKHQLELSNIETTTESQAEILKDVLPLIRLKVYDDLTFDELSVTCRYNWPSEENLNYSFRLCSNILWTFEITTDGLSVSMLFGFRMPISNVNSSSQTTEKFTLKVDSSDEHLSESFQCSVKDHLNMKDFYFREPVLLGLKQKYTFQIQFEATKLRIAPTIRATSYLKMHGKLVSASSPVKIQLFTETV